MLRFAQLFGGPDSGQSGPQINTWWLWPTSDTRAVILDGRALSEYLDPAQACSPGFNYTQFCSMPFNRKPQRRAGNCSLFPCVEFPSALLRSVDKRPLWQMRTHRALTP
jgi:hypothetical protein